MARYWVGGTGNWSDTAHWAASSGGTSGAVVPTSSDNVIFDANSGTGIVTIDISNQKCKDIDTSLSSIDTFNSSSDALIVYGNILMKSGQSWNLSFILSATTIGHTITTAGNSITGSFDIDGIGGSWTLQDDLILIGGYFDLINGTFNTNDKIITTAFDNFFYLVDGTLNLGASVINCGSFRKDGGILNAGTSTIICNNANGSFHSDDAVYYNITFIEEINAGGYIGFHGHPICNIFKINPDIHITFDPETITANQFVLQGTGGQKITLDSSSPGNPFALSQATGIVSGRYLNLTDSTATGGASFYADLSEDNGGNTGWIWSAPPLLNSNSAFLSFL